MTRVVVQCGDCGGSGTVERNPGWPDPQCTEYAVCPACEGAGDIPLCRWCEKRTADNYSDYCDLCLDRLWVAKEAS